MPIREMNREQIGCCLLPWTNWFPPIILPGSLPSSWTHWIGRSGPSLAWT